MAISHHRYLTVECKGNISTHHECPGGFNAWMFYIVEKQQVNLRVLRIPGQSFFDQASKGVWWMPWHREAMKDVATCDKPRFAGMQAIRGSPNGATPPGKPR